MRRSLILLLATACGDGKDSGTPTEGDDTGVTLPDATWYPDADGDGYGTPDGAIESRSRPSGYVDNADDCDDDNGDVHPGATELCDGIDNDCNGLEDEGYADTDADGTPDCVDTEECDGLDNNGDGQVDEGSPDADGDGVADCVDTEECDGVDNNGDGEIDEGFDVDGDGVTSCDGDCDDTDASTSPLATEVAGDGVDNDCDLLIDEGSWAAGDLVITEVMVNPHMVADSVGEWIELYNASGRTVYLDGLVLSSDGGSAVLTPASPAALAPEAYVVLGRSADTSVNDGVDVDVVYDGLTLSNESDSLSVSADGITLDSLSWDDGATMPDEDGHAVMLDGEVLDAAANDTPASWCTAIERWGSLTDYGSPGQANPGCHTIDHDGDGYSVDDGDCDDTDPAFSPDATEVWYDGVDQDCDEWDDDDADKDGYAAAAQGGLDCDDTDASVNPSATEVCDPDDVDEDCDGFADDDDPDIPSLTSWWPDEDGDGYGDEGGTEISACEAPSGYVSVQGDCDDADASVSPDATEVCGDDVDNDCDDSAGDCGPDGEVALSDELRVLGVASSDKAGYPWPAGDTDGDGHPDFWVGATGADSTTTDSGALYLVEGVPDEDMDLSTASATLLGPKASAKIHVAAGDIDMDGDGFVDVAIGVDTDRTNGTNAGAVYFSFGPFAGDVALATASDAVLLGATPQEQTGSLLAPVSDIDGDGYDDLFVSAPGEATGARSAGAVYLISGPLTGTADIDTSATATFYGTSTAAEAGTGLASVGDIDGDGVADLLVGAPGDSTSMSGAGAAYLVFGPFSGSSSLSDADAVFTGQSRSEGAGTAVSAAGDTDGDGYDDLLISAYQYGSSNQGIVYLVNGPSGSDLDLASADAEITTSESNANLGYAIATPGDIDGDGLDDVALGARAAEGDEASSGVVYLGYGPLSGALSVDDLDASLLGEAATDGAGAALAGPGDVDGDGYPDLLVGAPSNDESTTDAGATYLIFGGPGY